MLYKKAWSIIIILVAISFYGCSKIKVQEDDYLDIEEEPIKQSITLSFAGDVTMGNYIGSIGGGTFDHEFEQQSNNYGYFFDNVKEIFKDDDLSIVNLEGTLTDSNNGNTEKKCAFKGHPSYVNILKEGSIEAVSIANNHSQDYYEKGLNDTKDILDEAGIFYAGLGEKSIIDVKGIKVGFLAYNGWNSNYSQSYLNEIKEDINNIKESGANMVITYFHWGAENDYYPNEVQKNIAHFVLDNGSDLVVGSHPHVLQGIEKYINSKGEDKYIAYSLSNFCFGGNRNPLDKDSMIYQQTYNFEDGELKTIDEPNIIPCSISSTKNRNNYQPTVLEGEEYSRVMDKINKISYELNK